MATVNFDRYGMWHPRLLIPVQIKVFAQSGVNRLFWLGVDTAANQTVLRSDIAPELKIDLERDGTPDSLRALASELPSRRVRTKRVMVASVVLRDFSIQFAEIPEWIADQQLDGLLGLDFLSHFHIEIDFGNRLLSLKKSG